MTENLRRYARTCKRFVVLMVLVGLAFGFRAAAGDEGWKKYPYQPDGTKIAFPRDEGTHKSDPSVTMEWWYVSFHLEVPSSGREYAVMVAFFKEIRGRSMRLFNITSLGKGRMHTATAIGRLKSVEGRLDAFSVPGPGQSRQARRARHPGA